MKIGILYICFSFICLLCQSQNWLRTYPIGNFAVEAYDHGMFIGAGNSSSILNKTDINGNIIWQRKIGNGDATINGICASKDGGATILGNISQGGISNLFLLKLNKCGENEWRKIYELPNVNWYSDNVIQMKDDGYVFCFHYIKDGKNNSGGVLKTDKNGNVNWRYYPDNNITPESITIDNNDNTIITGNYDFNYGPPHNQPSANIYVTLLDSNGNRKWESLQMDYTNIGTKTLPCSGKGFITVANDIYSFPETTGLYLYFWDSAGHETGSQPIPDGVINNYPKDIVMNKDSTYVIISQRSNELTGKYDSMRVLKIGKKGNLLKQAHFSGNGYEMFPYKISATSDSKFLIIGDEIWGGKYIGEFIMKLNSNLDVDSFSSHKYNYDSLCTSTIVDTGSITLIGASVKNLGTYDVDQKDERITIYPNPAKDYFNINGMNLESYLITLSIFDISGRIISNYQFMPDGFGKLDKKMSNLSLLKGCYIIVLSQNGFKWNKKLIIE